MTDFRRDQCDTEVTNNNEEIVLRCHRSLCAIPNQGRFYDNQPSPECRERIAEKRTQVDKRKPDMGQHGASVCSKVMQDDTNDICVQSMMQYKSTGTSLKSLYVSKTYEQKNNMNNNALYVDRTLDTNLAAGMGLFINGGNPIYYTSKTSTPKLHAVIKQNLADLGMPILNCIFIYFLL